MNIELLIVENEEPQIKLLRDAIDIFNKTAKVPILLDEATDLEMGLEKLRSKVYDAAIVDLRLEQNDTSGLGNQILKEIKDKLRFPVRVISGHLGDLDPTLVEENYLFKNYSRGDQDYDVILDELSDIYLSGITRILNNKGLIETSINTIFWKHIAMILPEFIAQKKSNPQWEIEKVLLRYFSSHISEYLELNIENNLEPVHNIEFYIKPPVKSKLFTGDILKEKTNSSVWTILTPACDLATDAKRATPKAEYVTLACIDTYESTTNGKNSGDIKKLETNSMDLKFHFLPKTILFHGGFINFQKIRSIPINDVIKDFDVECVITNSFRKDVISRFGNYYSRQGQPIIN
jgi:hypothetical protein